MKYMQTALSKFSGSMKLPLNLLADQPRHDGLVDASHDRFMQRLDAMTMERARNLPARRIFKH
ncbi:hypothetical protein [Roseicitreum antarcticum]|nr:hypothetical protein [Roseicitreum antarcticum]